MDEPISACGHANRIGARFCSECGAPVRAMCPSCGSDPRPGAKFCDACGSALGTPERIAAPAAGPTRTPAAERKQVTVLFADLARSMELAEQFDPDTWREIVSGLFHVSAEAVRRYGGTIDKFTGDGLMALFGAPIAQEDHAARAAHAALALLTAAREYAAKIRTEHNADLRVRVGLNSGEVIAGDVGDSGFTAVGHTVGLAQRMESCAALDSVCISEHTAQLLGPGFAVRDLGPVAVKGVSEPVRTFALDAASAVARRRAGSARLVGRDAEWATLLAALRAADAGHAEVIGIVGEAGAGKSRLTDDLARHAETQGMVVRRAVGESHATTVPLLPIQGLLRDYFGVLDSDSPDTVRTRVRDRLLAIDSSLDAELPLIFDFLTVPERDRPAPQLGADARRRRILDVLRTITRHRNRHMAMVLVLEDLHWFDAASIAFLDEWLPSFPGTRTLVVSNFRPDFRAPWANRSFYRQLPLAALSPDAVTDLVRDLIGPDESTLALAADVAARSGGNPFFVEEIVRGWIEDGTLTGTSGAYRLAHAADAVSIPPSVQTVLAGRIDRLSPRHKSVLQVASVIGRTFTTSVLAPAAGESSLAIDEALHALCAAELVQSGGAGEFRFWHPLTQEVAYGSLLNATRRRHHRAVAEALLKTAPERSDELAPLIASHFVQARDHLEAGRWFLRAAHITARTDFTEAKRRARLAIDHLDEAPPDEEAQTMAVRARTLLLRLGARSGMAEAEIDRLAEEARPIADRWGRRDLVAVLTTGVGTGAFSRGEMARSVSIWFDAHRQAQQYEGPGVREIRIFCQVALPLFMNYTGPLSQAMAFNDETRALCAGDPAIAFDIAGFGILDLTYCLEALLLLADGRLARARDTIAIALRRFDERPAGEWRAWTLSSYADLADRTGEPADIAPAESAADEALQCGQDSGNSWGVVRGLQAQGLSHLLAGRYAEAVLALERALDEARATNSRMEESSSLAHLARAKLALGDEAAARKTVDAAVISQRQQAPVMECFAHLTRAQIYRRTLSRSADGHVVDRALGTVDRLVRETGARTWAPFLAEERVRRQSGDLTPVADAYGSIGATGHANRVRAEHAAT